MSKVSIQDILKRSYKPNNALFTLILGPRGTGKSYVTGTLNVPTLMLGFLEEDHGFKSAQSASKGNVTTYLLNQDDAGNILSMDDPKQVEKIYNRLLEVLGTPGLEEHFKAIVMDGFSALDRYVARHPETLAAGDNYGKDSRKMIELHERVVSAMKRIHAKGVHIVATCAATVKYNEKGEPCLEPRLKGTNAVDGIIGSFAQVLVVGKVNVDNPETGDSELKHAFQFNNVPLTKSSSVMKSSNGRMVSGGLKIESFSPRLAGISQDLIPEIFPADLSQLLEFITQNG